MISTERVFSLASFEGVRLIRVYAAKQPKCELPELLSLIENIEPDGASLDLQASAYLHGLVDPECVLNGDGFYQACISAVVTKHQPVWSKAMRQGRMRFLDTLGIDDRDVFAAAGLQKDPPPPDVVAWWDSVSCFARLVIDLQKMEQARAAEKLTMDHESARLGALGIDKTPIWKGLDDNFAGYDVLSYDVGEFGLINRMIEVKSTTASPLRFILTRHEWEQALKSGSAYLFHVWDMAKAPPALFIRTADQVAAHIPSDNEKGKWSSAEIPLSL
ncbi:MAG: DUF3883 domain-containing protein [Pseudomonadota bacterium]